MKAVGRWQNVPRENRICKICNSGEVHFIFRLQFDFNNTDNYTLEQIKVFMLEATVKHFARFLTDMYDTRRSVLYKSTPD